MGERIIHQGPGYTIAATDVASTMTGYGSGNRADGSINHGFVDLRDRPELVDQIPEASRSMGLAEILRVANAKDSPFFTVTCECHEFQLAPDRPDGLKVHVGGFVDISLRNLDKASQESKLIELAEWTLSGVSALEGVVVGYEMIVEPLKYCFGRQDCFAVMMKPHGYGATSDEAWTAFGAAAFGIAASLSRAVTAT